MNLYDLFKLDEGYRVLPNYDTERYGERPGLEGPMRARNGKVVYYDPREGSYYDPDTDMYIDNDTWDMMNENDKAIATTKRSERMLDLLRRANPGAQNDIEAILLAFEKGQKQDRTDINRLSAENDAEEADIDRHEKAISAIKRRSGLGEADSNKDKAIAASMAAIEKQFKDMPKYTPQSAEQRAKDYKDREAKAMAKAKKQSEMLLQLADEHGENISAKEVGYFAKGIADGKRGYSDPKAGDAYGPNVYAYDAGVRVGEKLGERVNEDYYDTDEQRELARLGRIIMDMGAKRDDDVGAAMGAVGMELTKYGTPQGVSSIQKLEKVTGQPESVIMKMMALAQKVQGDVAVGDETASDDEEIEEGVFDKDGMLGKFVKRDTGTNITTGEPNPPTFMGINVSDRDRKIDGLKNMLKIAQTNDGSGKVWQKGKVPTIKDVPRLRAELAKLEKEKAMQDQSVGEVAEAKAKTNFDVEDLYKLQNINDLEKLKKNAFALISKPSAKPMKPEKVSWFERRLEQLTSKDSVMKLMWDLFMSGEGLAVQGSRYSTDKNYYRKTFGEADFDTNFKKRIGYTVKGGAASDMMKKQAAQAQQQNRELDPGAAEKGLGIGVLDVAKARKKAKEKGVRAPGSLRASPNTRDPERLPEAESQLVRATIPNNLRDSANQLERLAKENGVEYSRQGRTVTLTGDKTNVRRIFYKMAYDPANHPKMTPVNEAKDDIKIGDTVQTLKMGQMQGTVTGFSKKGGIDKVMFKHESGKVYATVPENLKVIGSKKTEGSSSLNELDLYGAYEDYVRMPDGSYLKIKYRSSGEPGTQYSKQTFIGKPEPVDPETVRRLQLDKRIPGSPGYDGTKWHNLGGGQGFGRESGSKGPWSPRDIGVIDYEKTQPAIKKALTQYLAQDVNEAKKKPVPTDPSKWSYYKSQAKKKFDVYPSAYANAWAAKQYKAAGGGWRMGNPKKK